MADLWTWDTTSSSGGIAAQPALGRAADVWGYPASYLLAGGLSALALPFIVDGREAAGGALSAGR